MLMVTVNLIPEELRASGATPLPRMVIILSGVALNCIALVVALTYFLVAIPREEAEMDALDKEIYQARTVQQIERKYDVLLGQKREFLDRKNTIKEIETMQIGWAKKLDQVWDKVPQEMWLTNFSLLLPKKSGSKAKTKPARVMIEGYTCGEKGKTTISQFIRAIEHIEADKDNFFDIIESVKLVEINQDDTTFRGYKGGIATKFALELTLKTRQEDKPQAKHAKPKAHKP